MGKMKELFIEQMNEQRGIPDDTDWDAPQYDSAGFTEADRVAPLDPPPNEINTETGKMMWEIKGYKIWADNYQQALELLPMIESF